MGRILVRGSHLSNLLRTAVDSGAGLGEWMFLTVFFATSHPAALLLGSEVEGNLMGGSNLLTLL